MEKSDSKDLNVYIEKDYEIYDFRDLSFWDNVIIIKSLIFRQRFKITGKTNIIHTEAKNEKNCSV